MAKRGRPVGATNLSGKPFRDALRLAVMAERNNPASLRKIAERLAREAARGNVHAIREIADRLDGKPMQGIGQDSDLGPITVRWLDDTSDAIDKALNDVERCQPVAKTEANEE